VMPPGPAGHPALFELLVEHRRLEAPGRRALSGGYGLHLCSRGRRPRQTCFGWPGVASKFNADISFVPTGLEVGRKRFPGAEAPVCSRGVPDGTPTATRRFQNQVCAVQ